MSVLFSPSGLVADRAGAVAELLPWRALDPALRLAEERVEDRGGGFFQARYNKYRPVVEPGYFNDVLAPWPSAFRMWTVARLARMRKHG